MKPEFREERLRDFLKSGEGSPPPVFVGREDIIRDILAAAEAAWTPGAAKHGKPKMTRIVCGAPGAGKSSVLAELEKRCRTDAKRKHAPKVLILSASRFGNVRRVLQAMAALIAPEKADELFAEESRSRGGSASGKLIAGFGFRWGRTVAKPPADTELAALASWVKRCGVKWDFPLILAIDEAQNLRPSNTEAADLLQAVHEAEAGLPLTLVLAGLGDVPDRAEKMGLTRASARPLGGLEPLEAVRLMGSFCGHFRIGRPDGGPDRLLVRMKKLAAPCEGWPSHLHHALQAFGRAVLDAGGRLDRLRWDRIAAEAAGARIIYYGRQRDQLMADSRKLTAAVMRGLEPGGFRDGAEIIELIEREAARHPLPPGHDARSFRRHLVHRGALQPDAHEVYHSPIPQLPRPPAGRGLDGAGDARRQTHPLRAFRRNRARGRPRRLALGHPPAVAERSGCDCGLRGAERGPGLRRSGGGVRQGRRP